jgi:malate/lactate dehydrogenase
MALDKPANDISMVIGGHGDTTMTLTRFTSYNGTSVSILSEEALQKVAADTMVG